MRCAAVLVLTAALPAVGPAGPAAASGPAATTSTAPTSSTAPYAWRAEYCAAVDQGFTQAGDAADLDGDGRADFFCNSPFSPRKTVSLTRTGTDGRARGTAPYVAGSSYCRPTAMVDSDRRADVVCVSDEEIVVLLTRTDAAGRPVLGARTLWSDRCSTEDAGRPVASVVLADADGDGRADAFCERSDGRTSLILGRPTATGVIGTTPYLWRSDWCAGSRPSGAADFDGDGRADRYCRTESGIQVSLTRLGTDGRPRGTTPCSWRTGWCGDDAGGGFARSWAADPRGTGRDALVCQTETGLSVAYSVTGPDGKPRGTAPVGVRAGWCTDYRPAGVGDFTGDGRTDIFCRYGGDVNVLPTG